MNPFYFGESARPLMGLHAPAKAGDRGAVVLCYPLGAEYMRAHRAFRQLTNLLTRSGFHVLRFDYSCTGDSAGASEDASFDMWLEDVGAAIDEMKEATGHEQVSLSGLRLGATMAAVACDKRDDITRLVLWDPIVHGSEYAAELRDIGTHFRRNGASDPVIGVGGFPIRKSLLESLSNLDLCERWRSLPPTDLVVSEETRAGTKLRGLLEGGGYASQYLLKPSPNNWMEGDAFGSALIPTAIIEGVVQCLTDGA